MYKHVNSTQLIQSWHSTPFPIHITSMKMCQNDKVSKEVKSNSKILFWNSTKTTSLLPTCFWIIVMHSVFYFSLPVQRSLLKKATPCDPMEARPGSAKGLIWPKYNTTSKEPLVLQLRWDKSICLFSYGINRIESWLNEICFISIISKLLTQGYSIKRDLY